MHRLFKANTNLSKLFFWEGDECKQTAQEFVPYISVTKKNQLMDIFILCNYIHKHTLTWQMMTPWLEDCNGWMTCHLIWNGQSLLEKPGRQLVDADPVCQGELEPYWYLLEQGNLRTQTHKIYGVHQGKYFAQTVKMQGGYKFLA